MKIETEFDLDEVVYAIRGGSIFKTRIKRIVLDFHIAGLRSVMYEVETTGLLSDSSLFRTKIGAGERLLADNGLSVTLTEVKDA